MARGLRSLWGLALLLLAIVQSPGTASAQKSLPGTSRKSITIAPATATVRAGSSRKFYVQISGPLSPGVLWRVNGVRGGAPATGTITADGTYSAPKVAPADGRITIEAVSVADA